MKVISTVIGNVSRNANRKMKVVRQESLSPRRLIMVQPLNNSVHAPSWKVKGLGNCIRKVVAIRNV